MAMKLIRDIHAARASTRPVISFEYFPPKTEDGERALLEKTTPALMELKPDFFSVTYGAGGSTRDKTLTLVDRIQREQNIPVMMHLTCVSATREQIGAVLDEAWSRGIRNVLALRGDPPGGTGEFRKTEGGFEFSNELVAFIRQKNDFSIGTAGFPEGHMACKEGKQVDWQRLKAKIDSGAHFVITQLFFDNEDFYEFRDHLTKKLGVAVPLIPGILPVLSRNQTKKFVGMCGAKLPAKFLGKIEELGDDDAAVTAYGIEYATAQCNALLESGAPGIHFYTLNKAHSTVQVLRNLGRAK